MKIVMINGQNHKGSTYNIGRLLAKNIGSDKDIVEFFLPKDLNHFCLGCYTCIDDDTKCPFYEEKNRIMKEVEEADILIFTTPTYCLRASAPMKSMMQKADFGSGEADKSYWEKSGWLGKERPWRMK